MGKTISDSCAFLESGGMASENFKVDCKENYFDFIVYLRICKRSIHLTISHYPLTIASGGLNSQIIFCPENGVCVAGVLMMLTPPHPIEAVETEFSTIFTFSLRKPLAHPQLLKNHPSSRRACS